MFRATLFSIVLSLAVGQNVTLLCKAECEPDAVVARGGHHGEVSDSPSRVGDNSCDSLVPNDAAFLKEEVRRSVPAAPDSDHAIAVAGYQVVPATTDARPGYEPGHLPSLEKRPLETALRL